MHNNTDNTNNITRAADVLMTPPSTKRRFLDCYFSQQDIDEPKRPRAPPPCIHMSTPPAKKQCVAPTQIKKERQPNQQQQQQPSLLSTLREPLDVANLRRRIENREPDLSGMECCPWAQTSSAMHLATVVAADDPVGTTNHAVRWLMRIGNPYWFTIGLRTAVRGRHHALVHDLLSDVSLWPSQILRNAETDDAHTNTAANSRLDRVLRLESAASRKRTPGSWGPFSAHYYGPDDDDAEEEHDAEDTEDTAAAAIAADRPYHDSTLHTPSALMLDALLHGNQVAAECVMRAFVPSSWQLVGTWSIGQHNNEDKDEDEDARRTTSFVPTTVIYLGKKMIRATGSVPALSLGLLMDEVRQCMRFMKGKMPLVENDGIRRK